MKKLSDKQRRFCEEYLSDCNATQAAIRAGYSERTARTQGQRMSTKSNIQRYIEKLQSERGKRLNISQDDVIRELSDIAFQPLNGENMTTGAIKVNEKIRALELLGKHFGMFVDRVEQKTEFADGVNVNITVE